MGKRNVLYWPAKMVDRNSLNLVVQTTNTTTVHLQMKTLDVECDVTQSPQTNCLHDTGHVNLCGLDGKREHECIHTETGQDTVKKESDDSLWPSSSQGKTGQTV